MVPDGDAAVQTSLSLRPPLRPHAADITPSQYAALERLVQPHIESFDHAISENGLGLLVQLLEPRFVSDAARGVRAQLRVHRLTLGYPMLNDGSNVSAVCRMYPRECRERNLTYRARLHIYLACVVEPEPSSAQAPRPADDATVIHELNITSAGLPVMVKSARCNLRGRSPRELVQLREEAHEMGGYFICNGIERVIRMVIAYRRNCPLVIERPSFARRGPGYTKLGGQIRCVRPDQSVCANTLYYLEDGRCLLRFFKQRQEYVISVVLLMRALCPVADREIFDRIVQGEQDRAFLRDNARALLSDPSARAAGLQQHQCLAYLGLRFREALQLPHHLSDEDCGRVLLRRHVLVHLNAPGNALEGAADAAAEAEAGRAKLNLLVLMIRKLYFAAMGECAADNLDSLMNQELHLAGHLYMIFLRDRLDTWLQSLQHALQNDIARRDQGAARAPLNGAQIDLTDVRYMRHMAQQLAADIGRRLEYLISTGNMFSRSAELNLGQTSGFSIVAERINYLRYLAHFRCVHRGSHFANMKTTAVRRLLPEAWGFICPVHTPDGAPCGLLNHIARACVVVGTTEKSAGLADVFYAAGMTPVGALSVPGAGCVPVLLNGCVIGHVAPSLCRATEAVVRRLKVLGDPRVPRFTEIAVVPAVERSLFPGIYVFTTAGRLMRPVRHVTSGGTEYIGTMEQVYLDVACAGAAPTDAAPMRPTHREMDPLHFLSAVAQLTPFSDHNQSPRNMYQCQMGKQSMGVPALAPRHRADNRMYWLQTPQVPLVRPRAYDELGQADFATGTNAVVAVISYTGYDMEDAMVINKASFERGFADGFIYKNELVDLSKIGRRATRNKSTMLFGLMPGEQRIRGAHGFVTVDRDGLPIVGAQLECGDPLYGVIDHGTGVAYVEHYRGLESAVVDQVRVLGDDSGTEPAKRMMVTLRIRRSPVIGDKFASRHGQKGILSLLLPAEDMPFTECGMVPDILFNPHGFPSRMTIGMLLESMAGKSSSLHGVAHDASPFRFGDAPERTRAVDYFGEQLRAAGFSYYGSEPMYSGITGEAFTADVFVGVVYYQRLRHMVTDKFQVRTTGPVHNLTHQPVHGRRRAGGIRLGEMERDALLAHGAAFLLKDRLLNCSDHSYAYVCRKCGSIMTPMLGPPSAVTRKRRITCATCNSGDAIDEIALPYVFRYLTAELMAMNIRMVLNVQ